MPQKPYTTIGTLRDQVIYPLSMQQAATPAEGETQVHGAVVDCSSVLLAAGAVSCLTTPSQVSRHVPLPS